MSVHAEIADLYDRLAAKHRELDLQTSAPTASKVVPIREACERRAWSYSYAVKHWQDLGGFKDVDGHVKFSESVLREMPS
jgi:hypothetical protein